MRLTEKNIRFAEKSKEPAGNYFYTLFVLITFILSITINLSAQKPATGEQTIGKSITVCHISADHQPQTISIPPSALSVHLEHGDYVGECSAANSPLKLFLYTTDVKCYGDNDGSVNINISFSNGHNPFQIQWSNGATTANISGLSAGTYSVTVSIANGLSATASTTVNQPSPLTVGFRTKDVSCAGRNDGSASLSVNGGTSPYSYSWSENAGTQSGGSAANLSKGNYNATVIDANGCTSSVNISINEPLPLSTVVSSVNISCFGGNNGSVSLNVNGGTFPYNYQWSNGGTSANLSALYTGTYLVTITDNNGCIKNASSVVEQPAMLSLNFNSTDVKCAGLNNGDATAIAEGGTLPYSFSWSANAGNQPGSTASNLSKGTYSATVTDANGCASVANISIAEPLPMTLSTSSVNENCSAGNNGSASLIVNGGTSPYNYQWDSKTNFQIQSTATGLMQGTYFVTVSDHNNCLSNAAAYVSKDVCNTKLRNEDCGATMTSLAQFIYCTAMAGATNYQWEFSNSSIGFLKTLQRGSSFNDFNLLWVPGMQYGRTYNVRIKPYVNGTWKDYGDICQIIVPAPVPYTKVRNADCGISTTSLAQVIFCDFVAGAQNYQWEFTNAASGFQTTISRGSNSLSFTLGWVTGIQYGKTYDVRVRANVGGEWGNFGTVCQVSLVYPIPTTKVSYAYCGSTLTSLTQNIFCDAVAGATDYQWEIRNDSLNYLTAMNRNSTNTNFSFSWLNGIQPGTTYDVRVRAKVAGEWAEFGFVCQITTLKAAAKLGNPEDNNSSALTAQTDNKKINQPKLNVFPNPSRGETINISFRNYEENPEHIFINLYDMLGNIVYSNSFSNQDGNITSQINRNGELATGIYILNVVADNKNYYDKIIVR